MSRQHQDEDNLLPEYRDDATSTVDSDATATNNHTPAAYGYDGSDELDELLAPPDAPKYVPKSLQRVVNSVATWVKGPQPPRPYKITPFFPQIQEAPPRLLDKYLPKRKQKAWLLVAFYALWLLCFSLVLRKSAFSTEIGDYGSPVRLTCLSRFWRNDNGCGLNGDDCRPFGNHTFAFRCPANCKRVEVFNPHAVGDQEVNYRPLVIGGPTEGDGGDNVASTIYRGDSFICGSAIHAGFVNNKAGGCGVVSRIGSQSDFPSSKHHGIESIGFDSYFPLSYTFVEGTASQCKDLRWSLFAVSLTFTIVLSLFTTSPAVFFPSIFFGIFFHVALASDPPNLTDYHALVSMALGRFLPAAFCAFVIYKFSVRPALTGLTAQIEKTILWLGGCWVGALNNYTFDKIPIQRLTPHDLQQPGAIPALICVVLLIFFIALGQAYALRVEGRLPRYLVIYGIMVACILALVAVPKMNLRIHHYILALLLLPGTGMQNRPSLLYQGILVGLFINGVARWGFDSILQTPFELRQDAHLGTALPEILPPIIHNILDPAHSTMPNITFDWALPLPEKYDGVSILVNDVERFRAYVDEDKTNFTWVRQHIALPEYFRFAYMRGSLPGDYTKAGKWSQDGGWVHMKPGAG
ncbi:LCCL domain-containing protein [Neofusicoccum parvum]|uniref:LCCL domain-containing protein n=2 Tax=Neofusicoccum parvum TaxID=310453 RepID=A0ACB5RZX9_9PEZI|nr:putative lccl domain containing protein [Neofusicoccum parvum UCRNP2]GME25988.1 LCCL domain-containing protein [Neofusicoccum parvum]GME55004.1 LCCL domain-containing protein [Neofusicoccum parvum]